MFDIIEASKYIESLKMETIGELIPKGKITLIHGRSGCGKTQSVLMYLNENNIEPVLLDFDENDGIKNMVKCEHLDGYIFWNKFIDAYTNGYRDELKEQLKDKVFVIDTYAMADMHIKSNSNNKYGVAQLCTFLVEAGSTVVVTAHTIYYSGKDAQPDVDTVWANHIGCRLHLHKDILKTKTHIYLEVEKLRGYKGPDMINNWMR